ncbi:tetratricopeptide repeat protein [Bathymodiolus japonicus methanotrophic gill symbiont]|uniref:tetratricopeptide repeat protein n=1 Tax=Bathymodiolus japonicus methanotrophic gill symbiont TaxID=113269 RepID=UPI001C8F09DE|nr:tetratricopeptide repeat protein [Bathymodiolus japonicus methanotrophic gill symbiont]
MMYDMEGVVQDGKEALTWFRKAAEQGDAIAQFNLGLMYAIGKGVVQDDKEVFKWYRKAAEQGHARAQFNLGVMYYNGQGVPQDYVMAHKYFNIAASSGLKSAHKNRDIVTKLMTASQIEKAQNLASEWMKTHAENHGKGA